MNRVDAINKLGRFCGRRDVVELTGKELLLKYGISQADVMVLFGGSILCGGDVLAEAMRNKAAKYYMIVGGFGHTTATLREKMHEAYPQIETSKLQEAEVFDLYLRDRYGFSADYLETASTNCGNNITNMLHLIEQEGISCSNIILSQDATMQLRMTAGLRKYCPEMNIINYSAYQAQVEESSGMLSFVRDIWGMWPMDRYITLLLGEIPRLRDDENGYGPRGKNYIDHVDIPRDVIEAFEFLSKEYAIREANPAYATN